MLSLYKIFTVARYETKTLLRSWFFRIFSLLAIIILIFMNIGIHTSVGRTPWMMNGLNSSLPYMNILLMNVVQAIIGVFLASDFLKRDKKLDTTEVIYMRSMTNGDYVLGKTIGILGVFIALNIIILLISATFHIFFSNATFTILPYLLYPLFISIPTLVFIFGLSFLFMVLIRNQAVTFILLLGYIAVTLFFLSTKAHYVFDYMAFNVPLMYSDFIGFGNLGDILIHRGMYFLFGLGFIFATILFIKRLPQSSSMTRFSGVFSAVCILAAVLMIFIYMSGFSSGNQLRADMRELDLQYSKAPQVTPLSMNIQLNHNGKTIETTAKVTVKNETGSPVNTYIFSLNPALVVTRILSNQTELKFERKLHIIELTPSKPLAANSTDSLTINYNGNINEQACYLDVEEENREQLYRLWLYNIAKRFAIIQPGYVLLTPEAMWYPVAGLPYGSVYPALVKKNFVSFELKVKTKPGLTVISQGIKNELGSGNYQFLPENPLPQISLVIGNYEERSVRVDSVDYRIFNLKKHDYYSEYFTDINDTLAALIRDQRQDYEGRLGLNYPFVRFSLIEVPVQFYHYPRLWSTTLENNQPEMVMVQEKGVLMNGADFSNRFRWQKRRTERSNQSISPQESQSNVFVDFIRSSLTNSSRRGRFFPDEMMSIQPDYHIFPNFYTFVNHFKSKELPIFNVCLESFLNERMQTSESGFRRFFTGLTEDEKANIALMEQNLPEILADPDKKEIVNDVLKLKGKYLFQLIQSKIDEKEFDQFISTFLQSSHFKDLEVEQFVTELLKQTKFNLKPYFLDWYQSRQLPGFLVTDIQAYKILDGDRTRFQVRFKAQNTEDVEGLIAVSFRMGGGRGRFFGGGSNVEEPNEQFVSLAAKEIKEIGIVLDDEPRLLTVNTLVSKNLPTIISNRFDDLEMNEKAAAFDGERKLTESIKLVNPGEIVVDNEDPGFEILSLQEKNFLKKLFQGNKKEEEKYIGFNFWRPPNQWKATTYSDFYGDYIHSAYYIKSGKGNKKVSWNAEIKESGNYDIFYHTTAIEMPWMRDRDRGRKFVEQFHFLVYHDDGHDDVALNVENAENEWTFLGTYYLSQGAVKVEMSDKSKGRLVFADAVKWVKQ